jgi:glyoxylase-like metal-dependent hydrolase (beta-lactamase superfamily II)
MKQFLIAFILITVAQLPSANASAPQIRKQAPGYYRFMVGDIEITTLLDGTFPMKPAEILSDTKPTEVTRLLAQASEGPAVTTSVNGYLVNTGTKLILVDTGTGNLMGPSVGHLMENLKASGYKPEQVDEIYLTHMHGDHLGGLATDGKRNFPQATIRVDKHEADYWLSDTEAEHATNPMVKSTFATAKATMSAYQSAGKFKTFDGETELVPGIHALAAYGHTPGHTIYTVESNQQKLWLVGDMIHVAAVQFPKPMTTIQFDWNTKLAATTRMKDFSEVAKAGDMIGAAHIAFPGVGHIKKVGTGFSFMPLTYSPIAESTPEKTKGV